MIASVKQAPDFGNDETTEHDSSEEDYQPSDDGSVFKDRVPVSVSCLCLI